MNVVCRKVDIPEVESLRILEACRIFTDTSDISYYQHARNAKENHVRQQIANGKQAEYIAAYLMRTQFGYPILDPDVQIYEVNQKSWEADLPYRTIDQRFHNIHVKSSYFEDTSWTFQKSNISGKGGTDSRFYSEDSEYYALVNIHATRIRLTIPNIRATVYLTTSKLLRTLLKNPRNPDMLGIKEVVYERDLLPFVRS